MEFYRRNYIEGLFLSSGIVESPDYTMELICKTLHDLRRAYRFNGYIHCKAVPGASRELIETAGWYADRMRQDQNGMAESRAMLGMKGGNQSAYWYTQKRTGRALPGAQITSSGAKNLFAGSIQDNAADNKREGKTISAPATAMPDTTTALSQWNHMDTSRGFVPSG